MSLSYEDIQAIVRVLDDSPYDELKLENEQFSLYLKRNGDIWQEQLKSLSPIDTLDPDIEKEKNISQEGRKDSKKEVELLEPAAKEEGLVDVRSPMVGTFYHAPKPGADPFVLVGSSVDENSVVAIVEVMKLMNSIPAKISGEIREILAEDAQLVEKGQLLFRVRPHS